MPGPDAGAPAPRSGASVVFMGAQRLRAGWRVAIFFALLTALELVVKALVTGAKVRLPDGFTPGSLAAAEGFSLAVTLLVVAIMARIERRAFAGYGLTWRGVLRPDFGVGLLWGLVAVGAIVAPVMALGGVRYSGFHYHGAELLRLSLAWAVAMLGIGLAEEVLFRGYLLRTLADGLGFWPAALLLSLVFGAMHFFLKPFETPADFISVGLIGLFFCLAVRRTGDLWWAIGFHAGFDFAQLPLFAGPNSGNGGVPVAQALLVPHWQGADWLTGGKLGLEASVFVFPVIAALFVVFPLVYRTAKFPPPED